MAASNVKTRAYAELIWYIYRMTNMTRRGMMGLAAAALFQTLSIGIPARAETPAALPPAFEQLSQLMAGKIGLSPADAGKPVVTIIETAPHDQDDRTYKFLGSAPFLAAAAKAHVLTIGSEIGAAAYPDFMKLETDAFAHDQKAIAADRSVIEGNLNSALQGAVGYTAPETAALPRLIMDYVEHTAQAKIEVSPRDTSATDETERKFNSKLYADIIENNRIEDSLNSGQVGSPHEAAIATQRQLQVRDDAARVGAQIQAWRSTEECNAPIVAKFEADQRAYGGNLVVPYGVAHADAMEKLFRKDGYAVIRIALHASAATMKSDQEYASAQGNVTYRGVPFLMDTLTFAPVASHPAQKSENVEPLTTGSKAFSTKPF